MMAVVDPDPEIEVLGDSLEREGVSFVSPPWQVSDDELARRLARELEDEALARRLAQEETNPPSLEDEALARRMAEDEEFARRLQEEDERQHPPEVQVLDDEAFAHSLEQAEGQQDSSQPSQKDRPCVKKPEETSQLLAELEGDTRAAQAGEAELSPEAREEVENRWSQYLRGEEVKFEQAQVTRNYKLHALHTLLEEFPRAPVTTVQKAFDDCGSYTEARECLEASDEKEKLKQRRPKRKVPPCPVPRDLTRELKRLTGGGKGAKNVAATTVAEAFKARKKTREARLEQLRAMGGLSTCGCCFDDEVLPEEELRCTAPEGHSFCIPCVKRQALEHFGPRLFAMNLRQNESSSSSSSSSEPPPPAADLSSTVLKCMHTSGCQGCFSEAALRKALPVKEYERYSRRSAALHAAASGMEDLVACPSCDFMVVMSDPADSVVRCQNPECKKVSCRWCQEDDHRPLRCHEVEKDGDVRIRTFLEERMTEHMTRRCPKCRKPCEKTEGCNHVKCPCGTHICYLCGDKLDAKRPYDHYKDGSEGGGKNNTSSRCVVYGTPAWAKALISAETARAEAEKALDDYLKENPELQEVMKQRGDILKRTLSHVRGQEMKEAKAKKRQRSQK